MRLQYWSNTKLAEWIRGTKKPHALSWDEWNGWHDNVKATHPLRYWIAEELLNGIQATIYWLPDRIDSVRYYLRNRFIHTTHALPTRLPKGEWRDLDTRIIHALFEGLKDFVEIEKAAMNWRWGEGKKPNWFNRRILDGRNPEAGIDYLKWEATLVYDSDWGTEPTDERYGKPTPQAENAREIMVLYYWWTKQRPARPELYDDIPVREDGHKDYSKVSEREEQYEKEDTEMLMRLIAIRKGLWT